METSASKRSLAILAQDTVLSRRVRRVIDREALPVHAERVRQWANSDEGAFPDFDDARSVVADEFALLCEGLGYLALIAPEEYDRALDCVHPDRRHEWDADLDWYS